MATQTVLQITQEVCKRTGIPVPSILVSNTDEAIIQLMALFHEVAAETVRRWRWQALTSRVTWTSAATESQGTFSGLFGVDVDLVSFATIWNVTQQRPVFGPLDDPDYQLAKSLSPAGPIGHYKIQGNEFLVNPVMTAGETIAALVRTKNWLLDNDGTSKKRFITEDTDIPLLDDDLMILGLRAKYKQEKGLAYAEDMRSFESMASAITSRDGTKKTLHMDTSDRQMAPGIFVPNGSWPLT